VKKLYIATFRFRDGRPVNEWFSQIGVTPSGVNLIRRSLYGTSPRGSLVE